MAIHDFLSSGRFRVGCNYWASHAGAHMWSDWRPDVVAADLAQLAAGRLTLLRVFPLWPDFQPLHRLCAGEGKFMEYRHGEESLPDTPLGRAGLDVVMLERFRFFADEAHRHGLQLIVGLVTGWMSGRLFTPPAFANLNVITDPEALRWQGRFVRGFVETLRDHPAIVAWDLGNECNCMGRATAAESWLWTHTLASAIRASDSSRPVVSGMHGLDANPRQPWAARDQGELTDLLTTHPYPLWTRYCDQEPIDSIRPQLHSTAESLFYAGVGGKPCFAEEMGSMGPFIASDEVVTHFLRPALFSLWAHDCRAMLWWCAYDQSRLVRPPYDWVPVEQELGLHRADRTPKPAVGVIHDFARMIDALPIRELPPRIVDGVCLLTDGQDAWAVAQSAFTLAKLAGFDLAFGWFNDALPEAPVYLLPGLAGVTSLPRRRWLAMLERVEAGATLYVSIDDAVLADLEPIFGVRVSTRRRRAGAATFACGDMVLPAAGTFRLDLEVTRAEVHAQEPDGNPVLVECAYGRGKVFLLTAALEPAIARTPDAWEGAYTGAWRLYAKLFASSGRVWGKTTAEVGVTEHPEGEERRLVVLINHSDRDLVEPLRVARGWRLAEVLHGAGEADGVLLPRGAAVILRIARTSASS